MRIHQNQPAQMTAEDLAAATRADDADASARASRSAAPRSTSAELVATRGLRDRATTSLAIMGSGAVSLGAAALLVLSFGPSALALVPEGPVPAPESVTEQISVSPSAEEASADPAALREDQRP